MSTTITTNNQWREFLCRDEVPEKVLADQFDWTDDAHEEHGDYSNGFIKYRGWYYHLGQFMRGGPEGWDATHHDSAFSGVTIRVSPDGERYQIATITS